VPWAPDYATDEDLRDYLRIPDLDDDPALGLANTAASRAIDEACNRQFGQVAAVQERFYPPWPDYERGYWCLDIDDLMTATGLVVDVDGTPVATFLLEPRNAAAKGRPWERLVFTADSEALPSSCAEVSVVAKWGWSAIPDTVKNANLLQAARFFKRQDAPFGVAGSPDQGSEMRLLARVDPDVKVMLANYVRVRAPR
jgi:hypothetical protein